MTDTPTDLTAVATEVRREDDDELVGLVLHVEGGWVPATVFGASLGPATDATTAESVVREQGLSSLADRWWVRTAGGDWRAAWLLEVKPDRVRLRWEDPMLMAGGHGEWVRLGEAEIQRAPSE